jgi:hypothetical protein
MARSFLKLLKKKVEEDEASASESEEASASDEEASVDPEEVAASESEEASANDEKPWPPKKGKKPAFGKKARLAAWAKAGE